MAAAARRSACVRRRRSVVAAALCALASCGAAQEESPPGPAPPASPPPAPPALRKETTTLAGQVNKALEKEFEGDTAAGSYGTVFNRTVAQAGAAGAGNGAVKTVAILGGARVEAEPELEDRNASKAVREGGLQDLASGLGFVFHMEQEYDSLERLVDNDDNEFVISNPRRGAMELQQDIQLIGDLVTLLIASAALGVVCAVAGQPVITGYLFAGSAVGPGGFALVHELVQVETLAQFGVIFLLFLLGVEFSGAKLARVKNVALAGGVLEIALMCTICGFISEVAGALFREGVFVGVILSMSSTAVVLKCLMDRGSMNTLSSQVTVGTLILQDCMVGLLFAALPLIGGTGTWLDGLRSAFRTAAAMTFFLGLMYVFARSVVPRLLRLVSSGQELFQMTLVAYCLAVSMTSEHLGLSLELGAFVAGVTVSASEHAEQAMHQMEPIRNMFAALFIGSIGLIMNPMFLYTHVDVLFTCLLLVVVCKASLIALVVRAFGYTTRVAVTVGISMGQVGEFSFILLSRAMNMGLVQREIYLLLLGTTALSLVMTPLMFSSIEPILRLGTLMRWVGSEEMERLSPGDVGGATSPPVVLQSTRDEESGDLHPNPQSPDEKKREGGLASGGLASRRLRSSA